MPQTISHHAALVFVMVTISAVDRKMNDVELGRIGSIVRNLPVFRDYSSEQLVQTAEDCAAILGEENGLETVLDLVSEALPQHLQETAYALAVEVAAADLSVAQEELRFLQLLRDKLGLDKLAIAAIERGARARHAIL